MTGLRTISTHHVAVVPVPMPEAEIVREGTIGWATLRIKEQDERIALLESRLADVLVTMATLGKTPAGPSIASIVATVASYHGIEPATDLCSPTRRQEIVEARHIAMWIARMDSGRSLAFIGAAFGGRDPSTVTHAVHRVADRARRDPAFLASLAEVRAEVSRHSRGGK